MGGDRNVRLWSSNNGYLHAVDSGISSTTNLPFSMAVISDFEFGFEVVLAHPDRDIGEIVAFVALHSLAPQLPLRRLLRTEEGAAS